MAGADVLRGANFPQGLPEPSEAMGDRLSIQQPRALITASPISAQAGLLSDQCGQVVSRPALLSAEQQTAHFLQASAVYACYTIQSICAGIKQNSSRRELKYPYICLYIAFINPAVYSTTLLTIINSNTFTAMTKNFPLNVSLEFINSVWILKYRLWLCYFNKVTETTAAHSKSKHINAI